MKRKFVLLVSVILFLTGCRHSDKSPENDHFFNDKFTIEILHKYTPVKNQGKTSSCWVYATLSMIESEELKKGDSLNLSPAYITRMLLNDEFRRYYLSAGATPIYIRGTGMTLIHAIQKYGIVPYDIYPGGSVTNDTKVRAHLISLGDKFIKTTIELQSSQKDVDYILNRAFGLLPPKAFLNKKTNVLELARRICRKNEYAALTSFTHHPFYQSFDLEIPDNWAHDEFLNVPITDLFSFVVKALLTGHTAVWEGDISNQGFSFNYGEAKLKGSEPPTQKCRQEEFERYKTTDDHAMHIVGLAKNQYGKKFLILKNSWGTNNPYKGLLFMSENYFRMKTIAVFMPTVVIE